MITEIWALMIFLHSSFISAENPHEPGSWVAYLIANGRGKLPTCFVSLLSRTPGQKAESSDLLIILADCVMRTTENGLEKVNTEDLLVQFSHLDSNGVQDDQFEMAIAQVLYEDEGKSAKDRMALLRMEENVTSRRDLQPLIVPSSKPSSYEMCSVAGWLHKSGKQIPRPFRVELTDESCNNLNSTDEQSYTKEIIAGTPIICYTDSEQNKPQIQGFVKENSNVDPNVS
uniref:Uncharacterized protein n=1 Tax=Romanomermis culicivorax TaxID=13658 RepID=A0A915IIZ3_ROMCU